MGLLGWCCHSRQLRPRGYESHSPDTYDGRSGVIVSFAILVLVTVGIAHSQPPAGTEILWDEWGVPHIFAESDDGALYAYGWAQAQNHGELILQLYAQARGESASHFGAAHLEVDRAMRLVRAPERAVDWYEVQSPEFRRNLDSFAAGFTTYVIDHPHAFSSEARSVLPIRATDVLAHTIRQLSTFIAAECAAAVPGLQLGGQPGSNGWAIAPSRSESGNALLLANPHLGWGGSTLFFEAQIETPTYRSYGATLVGIPVPVIAFNDHHGWTHTTNTHDGCDLYRLELEGDGYLLDGATQIFQREVQTIQVRQADGSLQAVPFEILRSAHGPVVTREGDAALAMRMVGVDVGDFPGLLEQWWDMAKAESVEEFREVLARNQLPSQNVIYADKEGHILLLFAGRVPVRGAGDASLWRAPVAGDRSELVWFEVHPFGDLPMSVDPSSGWLQNSNSAPWYMTTEGAPRADDFPAYLSPVGPVNFREQRGVALILADERISLEELVHYKHDTVSELALRVLDDLLLIAQRAEGESVREAARVLGAWDRRFDADSRGAALYFTWFMGYVEASVQRAMQQDPSFALDSEDVLYGTAFFAVPWTEEEPLATPNGLANPDLAVVALEAAVAALGGQAETPWGDAVRMRFGDADVPANGGPGALGVFRVMDPAPAPDGRFRAVWGDSYVAVVEFGERADAWVLTTYGNASQGGSPHAGDALTLAADQVLRPAWRTRAEIEAHLEEHIRW